MPLGTEVGLGQGHVIVLDGEPAPATFRLMSIVAKRSPISATPPELLFLYQLTLVVPTGYQYSLKQIVGMQKFFLSCFKF